VYCYVAFGFRGLCPWTPLGAKPPDSHYRFALPRLPYPTNHDPPIFPWRPLCTLLHLFCRSGFYHLRQLRPLCRSLPAEATKTLVQAFISCCLYYCNSLLYGVTDKLMRQVQSLENAAARLITGTKRREHITSILRQLYWLPVRRRVEFEIAILVHIPSAVKQSTYLSG